MNNEVEETVKTGMDVLSIFTMIGALVEVLPSIAALVTIVWTSLRIYEAKTVQDWLKRRKNRAE
jgi:hypothetical protein